MNELTSLSVSKDKNGETGGKNVPIREITHIQTERYKVVVHTKEGQYYETSTLTFLETFLNSSGYKFRPADRSSLINVESIKYVDTDLMLAYFEDDPNGKSKSCTLSKEKFERILVEFPRLSDVCNTRMIQKKSMFNFVR